MNRVHLCAIVCVGILAVPLAAQQLAHVSGVISDPSGAAVTGAAVQVLSEDTGFRRLTVTGLDGAYQVAGVQPGLYKITVRKEGFRTVIRFAVKLAAAQSVRVDFALPLGSMQESVTVEGEAIPLESSDVAVTTVIGREQIDRAPGKTRGLITLLDFAPGTLITPATRGESGQFSSNGQRANSHYFTVDGVSVNTGVSGGGQPTQVTGGALPGMSAFGSLHNLVSLEAVSELRTLTSSAGPEFGRLPGVQVAITSRSGSNEFHGAVFETFRHEKLDANDWFANRTEAPRTPLRLNDFGATLGGPLHRDHSFFFLSYEGLRLRQPFVWRSAVPSIAARDSAEEWLRPVLNLFPAPNGRALDPRTSEFTATLNRPSRLDAAGMRLDHALTSHVSIFGRYNYAPSSSRFGGWQINQLSMRSQSATAGANVRWSPRLVQDFRANYSYASAVSLWRQADGRLLPNCYFQPFIAALNLNNNVCESFLRFSIAGIGQIVSGRETDNRQRQWNLIESMAWSLGSHQLRFGMDYRRLAPDRRGSGTRVSILSEGLADLLADRNLWISTSATEQADGLLEEWSVFAQDTWRVTPRLTLSYGLRWELNPPPTTTQPVYGLSEGGNPFGPPVIIETALWPLRYSNVAPRLGVAYRLGQNGNTVIRAGAGLYFDSSLSVATDLVNDGPFNVTQFVNPARQVNFLARLLMGYGFLPDLRLPEVRHWNFSVDHTFGGGDAISAGYIGSAGRYLLRREMGGPESNERVRLVMATNHGQSEYHSLQLQYRRRMGRRLHGLVSYAWSHSIDTASADGAVHWIGSGLSAATDRGSSDFDARHALAALLTYNLPGRRSAGLGSKLLSGWSIDGALRMRTGFPFSVVNAEHNLGVNLVNVFRPDLVLGNPIWLKDASAPGELLLNRAAFQIRGQSAQGNLGRNSIAGFGMVQLDAALQRDFSFDGRRSLLLRVEALNATNHANLADPVRFLSSPLFGESPSMLNLMLGTGSPATGLTPALQLGGARSIQATLRFRF